ncbi:MAG: glycosyltransferase family 39 protein, partial [Anaerolineales bacterium]|nr:glycosyltransferase family 39 protein [Anaerolineales bacterium]
MINKKQETLWLMLILLAAAVARLGWPGLTEFKADEARLLALSLEMANGGGVALRGISSSVGFPNFPMSVWLYAIPSLFSSHPYAATLFTGLLSTLAVWGCYWLVQRYWGTRAGLLVALLLALNPWAILYSRKIWAQNLLPLFVVGWAISGVLAFVEGRRRWLWLHLLLLAVAAEIHLAAVALVLPTAVYLIYFRRRIHWKDVVIGGVLGLLTAVPFFIYLWQSGALGVGSGGTSGGEEGLAALHYMWLLATGREIYSLAGPEAFLTFVSKIPDVGSIHLLWTIFLLLGLVALVKPIREGEATPRRDVSLMLLLWLLLPPLFFLFWRRSPIFTHYFISQLPVLAMVMGIGVGWLLKKSWVQAGTKTAVLAAVVVTSLVQLYVWLTLLFFVGSNATPGGFGVPLVQQLAAVDAAKIMMAHTGASEVLVAGVGESPRLNEFPAVYDTLLWGVAHRFVDVTQSALFPAQTAVVLHDGAIDSLYLAQAQTEETISLRDGEPPLRVLLLPGGSAPAPEVAMEPVPIWTNWVSLAGTSLVVREET